MGESFDERLANLQSIVSNYNSVDQQYIADQLSDFINLNYKNVDFNLTYRDIMTDGELKNYLNEKVYSSILRAISDLKEYRALQKSLFQTRKTNNAPSGFFAPSTQPPGNGQMNAQFNLAFEQQLDKNHMEKLLLEERNLADMIQNEPVIEKKIKLFHTLTFAEIIDNLANSIVVLFKQVYSLDISGFVKSQDNYIYYGIIFIFIYIIFKMIAQELNN